MSFELKPGERIPHGVRRVIRKRIDKSLKELSSADGSLTDEAVHEARTQFKQIRATLRLVRTELGKRRFDKENRAFRDAGRPLSKVRDSKVLVDTLDGLLSELPPPHGQKDSDRLRQALVDRTAPTPEAIDRRDRDILEIARQIRKSKKRLKNWPKRKMGRRVVGKGLEAAYSKAQEALRQVRVAFGDGELHEWRKRTKDLRYELELVQYVAPEAIQPMIDSAHRLTDLLGDDHDLAVLKSAIEQETDTLGAAEVLARIDKHRSVRQLDAIALGEQLFKAPPAEFGRRMRGYWKARPGQ